MKENKRLAIAIPTYNRAEYLDICLTYHIPILKQWAIPVFISDNGSTDHTKDIVKQHSSEYDLIHYYRNETTIGPDENFEKVLLYPKTEYIWLLGDTYRIPDQSIDAFLQYVVKVAYDAVLFNVVDRVLNIEEQIYSDQNKLLADLGWHMTCLSTLVYSRNLLQNANFVRYRDTNFLQTGIIFEYLADKPFKVKWLPQHSVIGLKVTGVKKTSWESQTFEIWTKRWANFVFSLPPSYNLDSKLKCIMDHGKKSGIFTFSALKRLRKKNILNIKEYRRYSRYFPFTISIHRFFVRVIASLPRWFSRIF
jgi:abequosyltransferase